MDQRVIKIALAIILFLAAYQAFYWGEPLQLAISATLFLSGLHSLFSDSNSASRRKFARVCLILAAISGALLIAMLLFF